MAAFFWLWFFFCSPAEFTSTLAPITQTVERPLCKKIVSQSHITTMQNRLVDLEILIKRSENEIFLVDVIARSSEEAEDFYDGNWLNVKVTIKAGDLSGIVHGQLRADELACLRGELEELYQSLIGCAQFSTMEQCLSLEFIGDGMGHIVFRGEVMDEVGIGNTLKFSFDLDQTFIPGILSALETITKTFPVIGKS